MSQDCAHNTLIARVYALWQRLTGPSALIQDFKGRRQAQRLSSLLLVLIPLSLLAIVELYLSHTHPESPWLEPDFYISVGFFCDIFILYTLSRTQFYRTASILTVGLVGAALFALWGFQNEPNRLSPASYLIMPILLSIFFFSQALMGLKNARPLNEPSSHANELTSLYRATAFLFQSLPFSADLAGTGEQIVQAVVKEFKKVDCGLMLVDADSGQLVRLGRAGEFQVRATQPLYVNGLGLVPATVRSGEVVYAPDVTADPRYIPGDARTRSELVVPLKTQTGVIGVLDLQSTEHDAFTHDDQRILTAFAERVAAVIENRQLYAQICRYTDELEQRVAKRTADLSVRNAVAETLSSSLDMGEMLGGVLRTTVEQLNVLGGAIYLLNADQSALEMFTHDGIPEKTLNLVTGITPSRSDMAPDPHQIPGMESEIAQTGISAVLTVPIWHQEQVQGVIALVHNQPRPWQSDETRMLDAIGRQIGVALANARLYANAVRDEAHIRTILHNVADGLLVFDQGGDLILMNPAAEALLAFYPANLGGPQRAAYYLRNWVGEKKKLLHDAENVELTLPIDPLIGPPQDILNQCLSQNCLWLNRSDRAWPCWLQLGGLTESEVRPCTVYQHLSRRAVQAHDAEIHGSEGDTLGQIIALHDVTYYRELSDLKGRFVSTVSHELRTPLAAVLMQVSTLLKYYDRFGDEERQDMLGEVQDQAMILRDLIEDILELSRFDAKRVTPQKRWFELTKQCQNVVASMRPALEEKRLMIELDGCVGTHQVHGDLNQLTRVVRNLLSNAIKYTPDGGRITVRIEQDDTTVRLAVTDTGIGIPTEAQPFIFERFFRSESAARMASGTGLGLAITKEIVEMHDGQIEFESTPGQGSTFTVFLPVTDHSRADRIPPPKVAEPPVPLTQPDEQERQT